MAVVAREANTGFAGILLVTIHSGFGAITMVVKDGFYRNMTIASVAYNRKRAACRANTQQGYE